MGRLCSVLNCPSGHNADITRRKRLGVRQVSLFTIPKRNNALQLWSSIIGQNLTIKDLICELHFSEESILKEDKIVMPDGIVHILPRQHYRLSQDALPTLATNKGNAEPDKGVHSRDESRLKVVMNPCMETKGSGDVLHCDGKRPSRTNQGTGATIFEPSVHYDHNENKIICNESGFADHLMETSEDGDSSADEAIIDAVNNNNGCARIRSPSLDVIDQVDEVLHHPMSVCSDYSFHHNEQPDGNQNTDDENHFQEFLIGDMFNYLETATLPKTWSWMDNPNDEGSIMFIQLDRYTAEVRQRLILYNDLSITAHTPDRKANMELNTIVESPEILKNLLTTLDEKLICTGTGFGKEGSRHEDCPGFLRATDCKKFLLHPRCCNCRKLRKAILDAGNRRKTNGNLRYARAKHASRMEQQACRRLRLKAKKLRQEILRAQQKCAAVEKQVLDKAISNLPVQQQEVVRSCLSASKIQCSNQRRYSMEWIYECLLMRIRNRGLYEHIRSREILPLPCQETLRRYIRKLDSSYGFQIPVFDCLKLKAAEMDIADRRGTLLIDEMSLSEAMSLDTKTLKYNGFVDLGKFTPKEQENVRGDHALVFMFQPFRGVWIQVLGCFLSKNSTKSSILQKLILECLLLLSNAGFHADVVTMDGAQWNRGVWKLFGIQKGQCSCEHPADSKRRLWMVSDFPHLIKCLRNGIVAQNFDSFQTPYGTVKLNHWRSLLVREGYTKANLGIAYTLTPEHLNPQGYQKMNVPLAFQLFSHRVRAAMEIYMDDPTCPELRDSMPTIDFIRVVGDLIEAMMSRKPQQALRSSDTCKYSKAIKDFLQFLENWENEAKTKAYPFPISSSTLTGLKVTLTSTLEVMQFLRQEYGYEFLMTARLNQDALERFFGMVRNSCGSNDHPDSSMFIQIFRLLCSYSLIKPPKGSNVSGTELLRTLMETKESLMASQEQKKKLFEHLDAAIEVASSPEPIDASPEIRANQDHLYLETQSVSSFGHLAMHDYDVVETSEAVQCYVAGYIAKKILRFTACQNCINRIKSDDSCVRDRAIDLLNRFGGLVYPSEELFKLTTTLERIILDVVGKCNIQANTLHTIIERVGEVENLTLVGCDQHEKEITRKVTTLYLVMRGHFLADSVNRNCNAKIKKTKMLRKNAKL